MADTGTDTAVQTNVTTGENQSFWDRAQNIFLDAAQHKLNDLVTHNDGTSATDNQTIDQGKVIGQQNAGTGIHTDIAGLPLWGWGAIIAGGALMWLLIERN